MHCQSIRLPFIPAVQTGKSDGVLCIKVVPKPENKKPGSPEMNAWVHNENVRACLCDLGFNDSANLFSDLPVTYPEVATPANVRSVFDNTGSDGPLFPFGNTQQVKQGWLDSLLDCINTISLRVPTGDV